ncbi:MAG TPA: toll/interleukin-1 receptor domain-containing protein, partial [Anaerolineales bacterium]|nr:toll/interleukin-1 receptor domain-containing protein [Anaerolineales bacterium]
MSQDVFISYSSEDKIVADAVVAALENRGIRCWYAPRDIKAGTDWGESITDAISESALMLLIFSES